MLINRRYRLAWMLFLGLIFFTSVISRETAAQQPPAIAEIIKLAQEYQRLFRSKQNELSQDELNRASDLDRQSRDAMDADDPERCKQLLKQAMGILNRSPQTLHVETLNPYNVVSVAARKRISPPDEGSPFGFHPAVVFGEGDPYQAARDMGVVWNRNTFFLMWILVQKEPGSRNYDWTMYDRDVRGMPDDMFHVINISTAEPLLIRELPPDAPQVEMGKDDRAKTGKFLKKGSYLPAVEQEYRDFIKAAVQRYGVVGLNSMPGLRKPIKYWQVSNEPPPGLDYARFLQITYASIKEADPEAKVIIGGVQGMPPVSPYLKDFDRNYLPILDELAKLKFKCFDILDFHWYGNATGDYKGISEVYNHIKQKLDERGLSPAGGYWITEMGTYSGLPKPVAAFGSRDYPFQSEAQQAGDLLKRYVYALHVGIKKVFGAFGLKEGAAHDGGLFDFTGLIFDGKENNDRGDGVRKLGYYTYQLMAEKLEGSDWNNISTISDGKDNVYAYKFTSKSGLKPVYVVWWDYFDEKNYRKGDTKTWQLSTDLPAVKVTKAITDEAGKRTSWETKSSSGKVELTLGEVPLFIEGL